MKKTITVPVDILETGLTPEQVYLYLYARIYATNGRLNYATHQDQIQATIKDAGIEELIDGLIAAGYIRDVGYDSEGRVKNLRLSPMTREITVSALKYTETAEKCYLEFVGNLERMYGAQKHKPDKWKAEMQKLIDEIGVSRVQKLIRAIPLDTFWRKVILSPSGLRRHHYKLTVAMKEDNGEVSGSEPTRDLYSEIVNDR